MNIKLILFFTFLLNSLIGFSAKSTDDLLNELEKSVHRYPDSILTTLQSLDINKFSKSNLERIKVLEATAYRNTKQTDTAQYLFQNIINHSAEISNQIALADAYMGNALIYERQGNNKEAIKLNHYALSIGKKTEDQSVINVSSNNLGYIYMFSDVYDSAAFYFEKSYESNCILQDTIRMASCKNNMFGAYYRLGQLEKAAANLYESLKLKERFSTPKSYVSGLSNLSELYIKMEKYEQAKEIYDKALPIIKQNKLHEMRAKLEANLGVVYRHQNKHEQALECHKKTLTLYDSLGLEFDKGRALKNIGAVYTYLNNNEQALKYSLEALNILSKYDSKRSLGLINVNIAMQYMDLNQYTKAKSYALEAEHICKELDEFDLNQQTYRALSRYYEYIGSSALALKNYKLYAAYYDSLNSVESDKIVHELEAKYETQKKEAEITQLTDKNRINELEIQEQNATIKQNRTLTFSILLVVIFLGVLAYLLFIRFKLKQKNLQIALNQQKLEIEQRMLRSQMNPHFIYNSLNSVQGYITTKRYDEAVSYLNKFASLSRLILENSRFDYVSLEKEISSLQLYAEIEQMKFQDKFDFKIIDNSDEPEFIAIPPMLLQPFVENSIKHGILPMDEKGLLTISYNLKNDFLVCTVEDNGIGREASNKRKDKSKTGHNSLALKLIMERLEILKKEWNPKISLEIVDFNPLTDKKTGTKTILTLPIKDL